MSGQPEFWIVFHGWYEEQTAVAVVASEDDAKALEATTAHLHESDRLTCQGPYQLGRAEWRSSRFSHPKRVATVADGVVTYDEGTRP